MNLVDKLLAMDAGVFTEKVTQEIEIKRLSQLAGEPFMVTVQEIDGKRFMELQGMLIDKNGKVDFDKAYTVNTLIALEGIVKPDIKNEDLQKHFGAATPKELIEKLFKGGEITKIADAVNKVSGYADDDTEDTIKN